MFTGLCAFPLTPFHQERIDVHAYHRILERLVAAKVDSICTMGSTGLYPYLNHQERQEMVQLSVEQANGIPVIAGIGALRTYDVLQHAQAAQHAGASALLLAPVSYHPLKAEEVFSLYQQVSRAVSVPLVVYDNPGVTQFHFTPELHRAIAELPWVSAIKIPGMPFGTQEGPEYLQNLKAQLPTDIAIGVSGDKFGVAGLAAGCNMWLSVIGGLFPKTTLALTRATQSDDLAWAQEQSQQLDPLWQQFMAHKGGMRVMATAADILGFCEADCLPQPLMPLTGEDRQQLQSLLQQWQLD